LPPVPTRGLSRQEVQELPQQVFELIQANLKEMQARNHRAAAYSASRDHRPTVSS
ncbi:MAG: hypothetical protein GX205_01755, partial [Firmicutes bacterium]|nr:hypothetical protein [Bacillota bacterium]